MRFSLRLKLFVAFIFIAVILLGIATTTMIGFFEKDKKTYIFDLNTDIAINLSEEIHTYLSSTKENLKIIADLVDLEIQNPGKESNLIKILFNQYHDVIAFLLHNESAIESQIYNKRVLRNTSISIDDLIKKIENEHIPFDDILKGKIYIRNVTISPELPSFLMAIPYKISSFEKPSVLLGVISTEKLLNWINKSMAFEAYVVDHKGRMVVNRDINTVVSNKDAGAVEIVKLFLTHNTNAGTIEFVENGKGTFLGAYSHIRDTGLGVIVQRPGEMAYVALKHLRDKTINMVLYVFVIALVASIIFTRGLTRPLEELTRSAAEIGKGNFFTKININSKDEIGDLAKTFNEMSTQLHNREREIKTTYEKLVKSEKMATCYLVGQKITSILDLEKVFNMSVKYARELANTASSLILLYDDKLGNLAGKAGDGMADIEIKNFVFKFNGDYSGDQSKWHDDIESSSLLKDMLKDKFDMRSHIIVPLILFDRIYGVLILINKLEGEFSKHDYNLLHLFAAQCAIACENARIYKEKEFMAVRDGLTGLFNRNYFAERAKEEFNTLKRYFRPLSYIILDIDYFKQVNDTYGHFVGDAVLKDIGKILITWVRETDIVFRYGGEEFVLMLINTIKENAVMLAERLRKMIEGYVFRYNGVDLSITVSLGVASISDFSSEDLKNDYTHILKCADQALYTAKENGRNRVEMYGEKVAKVS